MEFGANGGIRVTPDSDAGSRDRNLVLSCMRQLSQSVSRKSWAEAAKHAATLRGMLETQDAKWVDRSIYREALGEVQQMLKVAISARDAVAEEVRIEKTVSRAQSVYSSNERLLR